TATRGCSRSSSSPSSMPRARRGGSVAVSIAATGRRPISRRATWRGWRPTSSASSGADVLAAAQVVVLHLALEHVARDAERARRARDVAMVELEDVRHVLGFPRGPRGTELEHVGGHAVLRWRRRGGTLGGSDELGREMGDADALAVARQRGPA